MNRVSGFVALLLAAGAAFCLDVSSAYAQSAACSQLQSQLTTVERNGDFQNSRNSSRSARQLGAQVQDAESAYIRQGCNDDAKAGRTLSRQCQGIARDVLRLREEFARASGTVNTGNAVAQQREAILQEMARFSCGTQRGSSATVTENRDTLFDRIFGTSTEPDFQNGEMVGDDQYFGNAGYATVRTVCVRIADGYFWPISYSTLPEYLGNDAAQCSVECPNSPVDLYYYDNPGQEPEQMRNMAGQPYSSLPNAFRYRQTFDGNATCKVPTPVTTASLTPDSGGQSRAVIAFGERDFPLPQRDPRGNIPVPATIEPVQVASLDVPLPRRRPAAPGEEPEPTPVAQTETNHERLVKFGDRVVRVVGPDTPYAQPVGAGT